jgi:hypothetical protein
MVMSGAPSTSLSIAEQQAKMVGLGQIQQVPNDCCRTNAIRQGYGRDCSMFETWHSSGLVNVSFWGGTLVWPFDIHPKHGRINYPCMQGKAL